MEHKQRIILLDEVRGFAIIGMILYHFLYTLSMIFGVTIDSIIEDAMRFSQPIFAGLFILISGFSSRLSKNNYKRGLQILLFGLGISIFTFCFISEQIILFGILHFLGISILLFEVCKKWFDSINHKISFVLLLIVFYITFALSKGVVNIPFSEQIILSVYSGIWFKILGLPVTNFFSADYFPLFPWFSLFLIGTILGKYATENKLPDFCYGTSSVFLSLIGRKSLIIYLVHQPLIYMVLWGLFLLI